MGLGQNGVVFGNLKSPISRTLEAIIGRKSEKRRRGGGEDEDEEKEGEVF